MSWTCPYCNQIATITESNLSNDRHVFNQNNKEGCNLSLWTRVTICPNAKCREYVLTAALHKHRVMVTGHAPTEVKEPYLVWQLRPRSRAKPFPDYIPKPILIDYEEACLILLDSPKASATLARRCLQGMIRDYWQVAKPTLFAEIQEIRPKVEPTTWQAIDAVRSIGNIGAHMEKDINLIIDVEPGEAEILIQLLENLFQDWYVTRHQRQEQMNRIIAIAQSKTLQKNP